MKTFLEASLRLKLTVFVATVVAVTACALSLVGYRSARDILRQQILERLSVMQSDRCKMLREYIRHQKELTLSLTGRTRLREMVAAYAAGETPEPEFRAASKRLLEELLPYYPSFESIWITNPTGIVVTATAENFLWKDMSAQPEFVAGQSVPVMGVISLSEGRHQVVTVSPIRNTDGRLLGVVMALLNAEGIVQAVEDVTGLGQSGEVILGRRENEKIHFLLPSRFQPAIAVAATTSAPMMDEATRGKRRSERSVDDRGVEVLAAYGPVGYLDWGLVAKIDAAEAERPIVWLRRSVLGLFVFMMIAGIWGSYELARRFTRPIMEMAGMATAIAEGQRDARLAVRTRDEIGRLGEAFNRMAEKVAESQATLEGRVKRRTAALNAERHLLQSLMDHIPDNIYFKDSQGRFTRVNKALATWFGLEDPSQAIGKTDFDFFAEEHARPAADDEQLVMDSGHPILAKEEKETWPNGSVTWVLTSKVPFRDEEGKIIGTFGISRDITEQKLAEEQLAAFAHQIARQNRQIQDDLAMAREVQQAFLPQSYPVFPPYVSPDESALTFCHRYETTAELGGDFFEIIPLSDTHVGVFIGDVMGHGVRAALVMAVIHGLAAEMQHFGADPSRFLKEINHALATHQSLDRPVFASALYLMIDLTNGRVLSASAGHPSAFWVQHDRGQVQALDADQPRHGPVLGLSPDAEFPAIEHTLALHDAILLYTDGLYEVENTDGEIYGQERLREAVRKWMNLPAPQLQKALIEEARRHSVHNELNDDVCLVTLTLNKLLSTPQKT